MPFFNVWYYIKSERLHLFYFVLQWIVAVLQALWQWTLLLFFLSFCMVHCQPQVQFDLFQVSFQTTFAHQLYVYFICLALPPLPYPYPNPNFHPPSFSQHFAFFFCWSGKPTNQPTNEPNPTPLQTRFSSLSFPLSPVSPSFLDSDLLFLKSLGFFYCLLFDILKNSQFSVSIILINYQDPKYKLNLCFNVM